MSLGTVGGMGAFGGAALRQAGSRFVSFFRELQGTFIEREDLLEQIALALLARQHVLMTGPPGTAKSQLAHAVLGRIVSEDTGKPSLFARQFTESTVQTDLVGPIDFKTLMETGRTEHFTDEGILGAVHAFLDEVFDGRDMLLRSTLNVLQERELKEGARTTAGKIECALMTTNRYLAEILDNERLVAFVDRVAFLSFVPKGFARPDALDQVLRSQVAGQRPPELEARLTIQDVDLLQAAASAIYVDDSMCTALATLIKSFDAELADARRANPTFVPSRYLSTRTAVRLGELLRAIAFCDFLFRDPARPLEVLPRDLAQLRLAMTLCGPDAAQTARLLETETDARERRQLTIVRTEREIFDRCLAALPPLTAGSRNANAVAHLLDEARPAGLAKLSSGRLLAISRELAIAATSGQRSADDARPVLERVLREIVERALRSGLAMSSTELGEPEAVVAGLVSLADDVQNAGQKHVRAARWLRARALEIIERAATLGAAPLGRVLSSMRATVGDLEALQGTVDASLRRIERLSHLRDALRHGGVDEEHPATLDRILKDEAQRLGDELAPLLRTGLAAAGERLVSSRSTALEGRLEALEPGLDIARDCRRRLAALGADGHRVFDGAVTPLVLPIVCAAYEALGGESRFRTLGQLDELGAILSTAGLLPVLPTADVLSWSVAALLRAADGAPVDLVDGPGTPLGLDGYRQLRAGLGNTTFASLLIDLHLKLVPAGPAALEPDVLVRDVANVVKTLPAPTRSVLVRRDLAQLETAVAYFERWWAQLSRELPSASDAALDALIASRFFDLTHDESALTRFALEARLLAMVFEDAPVAPLLERVATLERATSGAARAVLAAYATRGHAPAARVQR